MQIEKNFSNAIAEQRRKIANQKVDTKNVLSYDEAMEAIREELREKLKDDIDLRIEAKNKGEVTIKNKAYLKKNKENKRAVISDIVYGRGIKVKGYDDTNSFINEMVEEFAGHSILADAYKDERINDIYCLAWNKIYVEKNGINEKYHKTFRNPKHYKDFIERLTQEANKELNNGDKKILDFELYEDRYCATSRAVSILDYSLTIRKHAEEHIKLYDLIKWNVINQELGDFLGKLITGECNIIIAGITGSGKTTTLRALLDYYVAKANKRMIVCEDTRELAPENDHTLELISSKDGDNPISLRDLVMTALRLKPKYIIIGEVRGVEAESAVEAMATGHSTLFSMHAGLPIDAINRLVTKYLMQMPSLGIDVVERIIGSAVDYIVIQDDIPGIGRRITSVTEVSYNYDKGRVDLKTIWEFDFEKENFLFKNKISKEKATKMLRRGIPVADIKPYTEWVA